MSLGTAEHLVDIAHQLRLFAVIHPSMRRQIAVPGGDDETSNEEETE
jgi:hypothetical protein